MLQQINLYKEPEQQVIILSMYHIVIINIVIMVFLFIMSIYKIYDYFTVERKFEKLQMTHEKLNKGLVKVKKTIPTEEYKKTLVKTLSTLQQNNDNNQKMYMTLINISYNDSVNTSQYLDALAEPEINDMWITKFHFFNEGLNVSLEGVITKNSSILQYLQNLGKNKIFAGKTFDKLQIFFDEQNKQMKFIVGSS